MVAPESGSTPKKRQQADQTILDAGRGAETLSPDAPVFPEPHPGVLAAPGEGGPEKAFSWEIKADSGTMGLARNGEGIYWDPKGQQKSLEGVRLDVKKKGSGTHR